ncbi:MAG: hypothetical protein LC128_14530 [Chitinophagales bacterium]|nr:hypothetical protein [Chitinophagales bacterium]
MKKIRTHALFVSLASLLIAFITYGFSGFHNEKNNADSFFKDYRTSSTLNGKAGNAISNINVPKVKKASSTPARTTIQNNKTIQSGFHKVEFGFNIGFLQDYRANQQMYENALKRIQSDGIHDLRVYELFTNGITQQPGTAERLVEHLVHNNRFNVLLCLSNFPNISSIQYKTTDRPDYKNSDEKQNFTNRYPPVNFDAYQNYLTNFIDSLQKKNVLQNVSFEIGNEPDSKRFFWGSPDDFIKIAKSTAAALENYQRPVYCCGFTAEFANGGAAQRHEYLDLIQDSDFRKKVNLSFHFYQNNKFEIQHTDLPGLKNSIITEFNFYANMKKGSDKLDIANSPLFGSLLIQMLDFAYKNDINKIYLFKLIDVANKEGALGFFDENGNPKPAYNEFLKVFNVVKDGFRAEESGSEIKLIGANQTIVYSKTEGVYTNQISGRNGGGNKRRNVNKNATGFFMGDWKVVNN